jgi:GntR family transcriptional regulator, transcriptional repressor for pyruvate dehydrogenase complex
MRSVCQLHRTDLRKISAPIPRMSNLVYSLGRLTPAPNLTSKLVKRIAADIVSGKLPPGSRLPTEQEIVNATGVSRTVVREAVSALRADGLVITRQGVGAFVSPDAQQRPFRINPEELRSINDVLKVFELRIGIETEAAAFAAERRTTQHLAAMRRCLNLIQKEIEQGEIAADADFAFHRAIFAAVGNAYFVQFLEFLGRFIIPRQRIRVGLESKEQRRVYLRRIQKEHLAIFRAIKAQNPEEARRAVREHLMNGQQRYRQIAGRAEVFSDWR